MVEPADAAETVLDLTNAHLSSLADIGLPSQLQVSLQNGTHARRVLFLLVSAS